MTKRNSGGHSHGCLSRRSLLQSSAALLSAPLVAGATPAWAQEKLAGSGEVIVLSYGGSFADAARKYIYKPFTEATGIKVVEVTAPSVEAQVGVMLQAGKVDCDVGLAYRKYTEWHQSGKFVPIDYSLWDEESIAGCPNDTRLVDGVMSVPTAGVLAYDKRAFPKDGPKGWLDFWDVAKFPGSRGLHADDGMFSISVALVAAGVARENVWPLTDDKLDRAFAKLDEIKPHIIKWWSAGGEAPQLLINREYAMTGMWDGRASSAINNGAPIEIVWDGGYYSYNYSVILKGGPNTSNAQKFIAFSNRAQIAAGFTQASGYPGPNRNQLKYVPANIAQRLSINPENYSKLILEDSAWLAAKRADGKTNAEHIRERWLAWRV